MSRLSELLEDARDVEVVKGVQFSIQGPDEIRRGSVVEVIHPETYEGNIPKIGGLFDPSMGVIDGECKTCEHRAEVCTGHFGHIELAMPVYNIVYMDTILKILNCICFRCSNLLVNKSDPVLLEQLTKKSGKSRFAIISAASAKVKKCQYNNGCMVLQPKKYSKTRPDKSNVYDKSVFYQIVAEFPSEALKDPKSMNTKQVITAQVCLNILRKISDEDVDFLGFSSEYGRPDWMIYTAFPIPPPAMRPSVRQDNNQRSEDDLTYALANIVKTNKILRQKMDTNCAKNVIDQYHGLLQWYVATFADNGLPGLPKQAHRSQRPLKTLTERLKGKEGRVRGNIMGKRVDYSARSVISVDTNISIDEFGVPLEIAMNLVYPVVVNKYNKEELYQYVRNGPNKYVGAKSVKKMRYDCNGNPAPCVLTLKYVDLNSVVLHDGDVVYRHLIDGDICMFNRQPSLHRMSMTALKVRILAGKTFKLNVFATTIFNADRW